MKTVFSFVPAFVAAMAITAAAPAQASVPTITLVRPTDAAVGTPRAQTTLSVRVADADGDTLTVSFFDGAGQSLGTFQNVASGTQVNTIMEGLTYATTYTWFALVSDGRTEVRSATWSFTTVGEAGNHAPFVGLPLPADGAVDVQPTNGYGQFFIGFDAGDDDAAGMFERGETLTTVFYNADNGAVLSELQTSFSAGYGGFVYVKGIWTLVPLNQLQTFRWYATVSDGVATTRTPTYSFKTACYQKEIAFSDWVDAAGAVAPRFVRYNVDVSAPGTIDLLLTWNESANLDILVLDPSGRPLGVAHERSGNQESLTVRAQRPGRYHVVVAAASGYAQGLLRALGTGINGGTCTPRPAP